MKKRMEILFLLILLASFGSAVQYDCVNGTVYQDSEEIEKHSVKSVGRISIGVAYADFAAGLGRIAADLLIDAKKISLTNETNGTVVELKSGDYTLELIYATNDLAKIKEGGNADEIEVGEIEKIGDLYVYLIETSQDPQEAEILVGIDKASLEAKSTQSELVDVDDEEYLVELISASDDNVFVKVSRCRNGNFTILEEQETSEIEMNDTRENANETEDQIPENTTKTSSENTTQSGCINGSVGEDKFCNDGKYEELKAKGQSCSYSYECESENCDEGICRRSGLLARFFNWLSEMFS